MTGPLSPNIPSPGGRAFRHLALLYDDRPDFVRQTGRFVEEALGAGMPVLVAVPEANLGALREHVRRRCGVEQAESVRWIDMSTAGRNPGRILPRVLHAFVLAHAGQPVLMVGEPIWPGRSSAEYAAAVRHEALINLSFVDHPVTVVCPYDRSRLPDSALFDAELTHPEVQTADGVSTDHGYGDPVVTAAEALECFEEPAADAVVFVVLDVSDLARMRQVVAGVAESAQLDEERTTDLSLAVHEVCTNSLVHAGGPAVVRVWAVDGEVVCEVHDRGTPADPLIGRRAARPGQREELGLLLVNELCDLVEVAAEDHGMTSRLHVRVEPLSAVG